MRTTAFFLGLGILLIATNLRAPFTCVAPLLPEIQHGFDLTAVAAGMLTTMPLVAFAVVSPFGVLLTRNYGLDRSLFVALVVIGAGIAVRSTGSLGALYLGTWVIGSGIAMGNVLLPSLLKRDFPGRITLLTALYVLTMGLAAALASAVAVPLSRLNHFGWTAVLAASGLFTIAALVVWLPRLRGQAARNAASATSRTGAVWHSALAWQVTVFFGVNSFLYYVAIAWSPAILQSHGYSPQEAGMLHGWFQLISGAAGLVLPPVLRRLKDQRMVAFVNSMISMVAFACLLFVPQWAMIWTVLYGFSSGVAITLGLAFLSLRAASEYQAASLSGMAQSAGYLLAAVGPALVGALHDWFGGWSTPLALCVGACGIAAVFGLFAGRETRLVRKKELGEIIG